MSIIKYLFSYSCALVVKDIIMFLYILSCLERFQVSGIYLTTTILYFKLINSSAYSPIEIRNNITEINWQYSPEQVDLSIVPNIIPICCPPGHIYRSSKCMTNATIFANKLEFPPIYDEYLHLSKNKPDSFQRKEGIPCANGFYVLNSGPPNFDVFYLLENGTIYENNTLHGYTDTWFGIEEYCLASIIDENNELKTVVAVCFPLDNIEDIKHVQIVYPIAMAISLPFLAVTFLIYAFLPELRNIHGTILMAYVASLFMAYVALMVVQFGNETIIDATNLCITLVLFDNSTYCPKEALTLLKNAKNVKMNFGLIPTIQPNFNTVNINGDNEVICPCLNKTCFPICCPHGQRISRKKCISIIHNWRDIDFPQIHDSVYFSPLNDSHFNFNNLTNDPEYYNDDIHIFIRDPCSSSHKFRLNPKKNKQDEFKLMKNGTIVKNNGETISLSNYCWSIVDKKSYSVVLCLDTVKNVIIHHSTFRSSLNAGMLISLPFLLITFVIYSIISELNNVHGFTLRNYVGSLFVAYGSLAFVGIGHNLHFSNGFCITVGFVIHFALLSSFFWLNVMCFDIWWTFGGFRGLQGTAKQRERKKFIIYSIYAWGCASFFTGICLIMDFLPQIPSHFIRPQFGKLSCWFMTDAAKAIYFYAPMGVTIVCNITLFISTALKIIRHKKEMAHHLKSIDSCRHDDNKQWFNLYLKLFIVMGINWSMEIISWMFSDAPEYVWYITDLANTLQGVIIFIIFVWKDKIKRLLWKRLGINTTATTQSRNSIRSGGFNSSNITSKILVPLREQNSLHQMPNVEQNHFATTTTTTTDDNECV